MFFFKKKKTASKKIGFDTAFHNRLGRFPVDYIAEKIANGSDERSIRYFYDIISAEIASQNRCKAPSFDRYYQQRRV